MNENFKRQHLVGFSLRILPVLCEKKWSLDKRNFFLLDPDTPEPLSADDMMWSCLDEDVIIQFFDKYCINKITDVDLLYNKIALLKNIPSDWFDSSISPWSEKAWLIALSAELKFAEELKYIYGDFFPNVELQYIINRGWCFIGFDILDEGSISGLMNCGYMNDEKKQLANFIPFLNYYGLFNSFEVAKKFSVESDKRVPEHAPFHIAGIWVHPSSKNIKKNFCLSNKEEHYCRTN